MARLCMEGTLSRSHFGKEMSRPELLGLTDKDRIPFFQIPFFPFLVAVEKLATLYVRGTRERYSQNFR